MTTQEILVLAGAGFNAQQIAALNSLTGINQNSGQTATSSNQPASFALPTVTHNNLDSLSQQIAALTGSIQMGNILGSQQVPQVQSTDDILASIINPPMKESVPSNK